MPRLNGNDMENKKLPTGSYGYSAVKLDSLGASEYTLATLVVDVSGSVDPFKREIENTIKEVVNACKLSPRADNLMLRVVTFANTLEEVHGYKLLEQCNLNDYNKCLKVGGCTALYDAAENAVDAAANYGKTLLSNDFSVNGIVVVITDGADNQSVVSQDAVGKSLDRVVKTECMESLVSILVGVGAKQDPTLSKILTDFHTNAGFTQYVELADANAKTLAKLAAFISKSISAQSQSLGTGGPSTPISLTI
jgi:uncharacterized protein YegL